MSADERETIHKRFLAHPLDGPCPIEAALSARVDDTSLRAAMTIFGVILVAAVVVYVLFPHARVFVPVENKDETLRSQVVLFAAIIEIIPGLLTLPRLIRERAENFRLARSGPDCDPWVNLEHDERARVAVSWKRAMPDLRLVIGFRRRPGNPR